MAAVVSRDDILNMVGVAIIYAVYLIWFQNLSLVWESRRRHSAHIGWLSYQFGLDIYYTKVISPSHVSAFNSSALFSLFTFS